MKRLLLSAFTVLMLLGCGERKQASDSSNEGIPRKMGSKMMEKANMLQMNTVLSFM